MNETSPSETRLRCPKCGAPHARDAEACPRCGLVFARWNAALAAPIVELDATADSLWQAVVADWDDEGRHLAFLKYCAAAALLGAAGRRYRDRLAEAPDDAMAQAMQKKILGMALLWLGPPSQRPEPSFLSSRWFILLVFLCALVGMVGGFFLYRR